MFSDLPSNWKLILVLEDCLDYSGLGRPSFETRDTKINASRGELKPRIKLISN